MVAWFVNRFLIAMSITVIGLLSGWVAVQIMEQFDDLEPDPHNAFLWFSVVLILLPLIPAALLTVGTVELARRRRYAPGVQLSAGGILAVIGLLYSGFPGVPGRWIGIALGLALMGIAGLSMLRPLVPSREDFDRSWSAADHRS